MMQTLVPNRHWLGGVAQSRLARRRPSAAPCCRRLQRMPLCPSAAAAQDPAGAAPGSAGCSCFQLMVAAGKLTKTAAGKLTVAELRAECERLQLPTDGTKPVIVERLMEWYEEYRQQQRPGQQQASSGSSQSSSSTPAPAPAPAAASAAAPATAPPAQQAADAPAASAQGSEGPVAHEGQQQAQQQQQQQRQSSKQAEQVNVTWLGTSSGNPTPRRNVSSISVRFDEDVYLVDVGEGTRNQLRTADIDPACIRRIFTTHMHGDHCFGLGGVISAIFEARLGTPQQQEPLYVYGPPEVQSLVMAAIRLANIQLTSPLVVTGFVLDPRRARPPTKVDEAGMLQMVLQGPDQGDQIPAQLAQSWQAAYDQGSEKIVQVGLTWTVRMPGGPTVTAAQLQHRVPCWGYVFQESPQAVPPPQLPSSQQQQLGSDGSQQQEHEHEQEPAAAAAAGPGKAAQQWVQPGRKLVILGDTCDSSAIAPLALGCDLLSHEATFCSGMEEKASIAQHSTTEQAGAFAAAVDAQALVLTHFSARYESVSGMAFNMKQRSGGSRTRSQLVAAVVAGDMKRSEQLRLLDETHSTYGKDTIYLAHDFYTHEVPAPQPLPLHKHQAQQAQAQAAAAAVVAAAQQAAQRRPAPPQQQQQYQQQYQQRRPRSQQQQYQQQRSGGGSGQYERRQRQHSAAPPAY